MRQQRRARSFDSVTRSDVWFHLAWCVAALAVVVAACDSEAEPFRPGPPQPEQQSELVGGGDDPNPQPSWQPRIRELILTSDDVGSHLEGQQYEANLRSWLESSEDSKIADLPKRVPAEASSGIVFSPSQESVTDETLWVHVFTDQSVQLAIDWVEHVASGSAQVASVVVPRLQLFGASFLPAPSVGAVSVSIEMLYGHSNNCWHSVLLMFAQEGVLVFLLSSIEITREEDGSTEAASDDGLPLHCNVAATTNRLTDVDAIAWLISERLSEEPADSAATTR